MTNCTLRVVDAEDTSNMMVATTLWNLGMVLCMTAVVAVQAINTRRMTLLVDEMRTDSSAEMRSRLVNDPKKNGEAKMDSEITEEL